MAFTKNPFSIAVVEQGRFRSPSVDRMLRLAANVSVRVQATPGACEIAQHARSLDTIRRTATSLAGRRTEISRSFCNLGECVDIGMHASIGSAK